MYDRLNFQVSKLSDGELQDRLENRQDNMPETTEAVLAEMQKRGVEFEPEELLVITEDIQAQRDNANEQRSSGFFNQTYKNTIVPDPFAPYMYSRKAIYGFTFFMGALFGSIMLAINAAKIRNNQGIWISLLFGVLYTSVQLIVVSNLPVGSMGPIFFGIVAGFIADFVLWPRIIGNHTFYRSRPIWVPLAIALVLAALIIFSVISSKGFGA